MALRYQPTAAGEQLPGYPRGRLSDEWLAAQALRLGVAVAVVEATARSYRRVDGRSLYAPEGAAPPPPVRPFPAPLGTRPRT